MPAVAAADRKAQRRESRESAGGRDAGPPVEPLFGASPRGSPERSNVRVRIWSLTRESGLSGHRAAGVSILPGRRLQNIDSRIAGSDPHAAHGAFQHQGRVLHRSPGDCGSASLCRNDAEAVGVPVPSARDPSVLDRDPQITLRIFDHLKR